MITLSDNRLKLFGIILLISLIWASPLMADYAWPLPVSKELTSGFCAYRSGHYHAGIDIRTFGKTGYKAVAVEDGYLWRVSSNWWGYGNVVYVKLKDGNIAVYAHLSEFTPEVEAYVRQYQRDTKRFKVNLFPDSNQFRFKKGDLVGKTGQSGVGAPHLHFEIRTPDNEAVSPLTFYPQLRDGRAPRFEEITLVPLTPGSLVEGRSAPKSYRFVYSKENNNYFMTDIPSISGSVGLEVKVADRRNSADRKFNVSGLELLVDDKSVFKTRYDTLNFDSWGLVDNDYNHYQRIDGGRYYHNLYYINGNKSPFHTAQYDPQKSAVTTFSDSIGFGIHDLKIMAFDAYGKPREALLKLEKTPSVERNWAVNLAADSADPDNLIFQLSYCDKINIEFEKYYSTEGLFKELNTQTLSTDDFSYTGSTDFLKMALKMMKYPALAQTSGYEIIRMNFYCDDNQIASYLVGHSGNPRRRFLSEGLIDSIDFIKSVDFSRSEPIVQIDPDKFYKYLENTSFQCNFIQPIDYGQPIEFPLSFPLILKDFAYGEDFTPLPEILVIKKLLSENYHLVNNSETYRYENDLVSFTLENKLARDIFFKLDFDSEGIAISPDDRLLDPAAKLFLAIPDGIYSKYAGLYGISRGGDPGFIANDFDSLGRVGGAIRSFGTYRVLADSAGPLISHISPGDGAVVKSARPQISFRMKDELAGFDSDTLLTVTLDGEYLVSEYDVDNEIVYSYLYNALSEGSHKLQIVARDRLGNTTVKGLLFKYLKSE